MVNGIKGSCAGPVFPFTRPNNRHGEPVPIPEPRVEEDDNDNDISSETSTSTPDPTSPSDPDPQEERFGPSAPDPPVPCFQCAMNIFTRKPPNGEIIGPHHCIPADKKDCIKCKEKGLECWPLPLGAHRDAIRISRMPPILRARLAAKRFAYELEKTYVGFYGDWTDDDEEEEGEEQKSRRRSKAEPFRRWVLGRI
ncbi:hypothetical protein BJX62DRAFT_234273 [Aspergillus germanicus]